MNARMSDIAQRILTRNKKVQKKGLHSLLGSLHLPREAKALDFGCGTGLFAPTILRHGLAYVGFDVDQESVSFASDRYSEGLFSVDRERIRKEAPYDLILANCCFHHIDDSALHNELAGMKEWISDDGCFVMEDILRVDNDPNPLHRLYMKLERGEHVRSLEEYKGIVREHFDIIDEKITRTHVFAWNWFPLYNDLVMFICKKAGAASTAPESLRACIH